MLAASKGTRTPDMDTPEWRRWREELDAKSMSPNCLIVDHRYKPPYSDKDIQKKALSDDALMMKLFEQWMVDFETNYPTEEEKQQRFHNFKLTVKFIYDNYSHPVPPHPGVGVGVFADLAPGEYPCNCGGYSSSEDDEQFVLSSRRIKKTDAEEEDSHKRVKTDAEEEDSNKRVKTDAD